jgi:hypothetical protein
VVSTLDTLSQLGFDAKLPQIAKALHWLKMEQQPKGSWKLRLVRGKDKDLDLWMSFAICRVFKRFYHQRASF